MDHDSPDSLIIDPGEGLPVGVPTPEQIAARRADIEAKQEQLAEILEEMECEAALLLVPANVAWFTAGLTARGLVAETERPGVFTTGRQRWLVCSNVDTQRLFDEEIDQLGFQLKEWSWDLGRSELLMNIVSGRKVAADRPHATMPLIAERLRPLLRVTSPFERVALAELGRLLVHALEATARGLKAGDTEEEAVGQLGHRLLHRGVEPVGLGATADDRGRKYRRAGFTRTPIRHTCTLQATGQHAGLYVTAARTVSFGPPPAGFRIEFDHAARVSAVYRTFASPGEIAGTAVVAATKVLAGTPYEYEGRLSPPGHSVGRVPADELRRGGKDEPFADGQAIAWEARIGAAAVVDTVVVTSFGPTALTPPDEWPVKRIRVADKSFEVPDLLVREE